MKRTRFLWIVAVAVIVALLAPLQQAGPAPRGQGVQDDVAPYSGLSAAQRANLLSIARDTWKFYGVDVDTATNLPMDNLTFAGEFGHADLLRPLHLGGQHRGVPVGPWSRPATWA